MLYRIEISNKYFKVFGFLPYDHLWLKRDKKDTPPRDSSLLYEFDDLFGFEPKLYHIEKSN